MMTQNAGTKSTPGIANKAYIHSRYYLYYFCCVIYLLLFSVRKFVHYNFAIIVCDAE